MFDNLREEAKDSPLFKDSPPPGKAIVTRQVHIPKRVLGMNAPQRFIVSVFIFLTTTVLGLLTLLAAQKIMPF